MIGSTGTDTGIPVPTQQKGQGDNCPGGWSVKIFFDRTEQGN